MIKEYKKRIKNHKYVNLDTMHYFLNEIYEFQDSGKITEKQANLLCGELSARFLKEKSKLYEVKTKVYV
ncbi:MAG: hypothetical protein CMC70_04660 [Flavobacteriaceae bacterium]|jgi:hypothetical protein|nr:hypothetical protein [Flavobacteriaceae bacterium]|tara:strand:- start:120 stop:326 length:207 start_codon:yes stop_codon:yes gene_type:complete